MADNLGYTEGAGKTVAADDVGGVYYQYMKVVDGTADSTTKWKILSDGAAVLVDAPTATTTLSNVAGAALNTTILAANANRYGATVYNDSSASLYLKLNSGAASTSSFTVLIPANEYYEVPYRYTGQIQGIWSSATGNARVTEFTA